MQRGATAVIFDVSENPEAIDQVNSWGQAHAVVSLREALPLLGVASHTPVTIILRAFAPVCPHSLFMFAHHTPWQVYREGSQARKSGVGRLFQRPFRS